jgi:CheY-like chemotaxis protein
MLLRVFEMFSQIHGGQSQAEGGIGIGLALVKGCVELPAPGAAPAGSPPTGAGSSRRVLVADDNRDGADIMALLLQQDGYVVSVAHSGPEALAVAAQDKPQIAILDIGMPGMNGYEVAQRIRAHGWGANMLLIALTGWGQEDDKRKALEAGFDHHLIKPIDPDALEALMAAADK